MFCKIHTPSTWPFDSKSQDLPVARRLTMPFQATHCHRILKVGRLRGLGLSSDHHNYNFTSQGIMLTQYLFVFAQVHDEFRIPELLSISELYGFEINFPEDQDISRPFMILGLESEDHARLLARRCILIRCVT